MSMTPVFWKNPTGIHFVFKINTVHTPLIDTPLIDRPLTDTPLIDTLSLMDPLFGAICYPLIDTFFWRFVMGTHQIAVFCTSTIFISWTFLYFDLFTSTSVLRPFVKSGLLIGREVKRSK